MQENREDASCSGPRRERILFITQWFDPEPAFKGLQFALELQRLGHEVRVLTGFPNYPGGKVYPGYRVRPWRREVVEGISITRVALYPSHSRSAIGRIVNYVSFGVTATLAALILQRPDVVYLYHPPGTAALPALALRLLKGTPFVIDVQDLWPDTLAATGMMPNKRAIAVVEWWMRRVYQKAAHVVVLSNGFRRALLERGVPDEKISVIANWTYEADASATETPDCLREFAGRFNVLFAGQAGKAQRLETVIEAAAITAKTAPEVQFVFMGGGIETDCLRALAERRGLSNVVFLPRREPSEMPAIFARADALLVHLKDDPLFSITIPSKTQAYLRAGRFILMGVKGDAAEMVQEAGAGLVFEPENAESLAKAVCAALAMDPGERIRMGLAGADYYRRELELGVGVRRWLEVLARANLAGRRGFAVKGAVDV